MAGEKRRGPKRSAAEERDGEERFKTRKVVTQQETGKRKGKLQIKGRRDRDKPTEADKKQVVSEDEAAADYARRMTEQKVAFYKQIVAQDCSHLCYTERMMQCFPGGPDAARAINATMRTIIKEFKERAAMRLKEYEANGYLEGYPPDYSKLPRIFSTLWAPSRSNQPNKVGAPPSH